MQDRSVRILIQHVAAIKQISWSWSLGKDWKLEYDMSTSEIIVYSCDHHRLQMEIMKDLINWDTQAYLQIGR